MNDYFRWLAEMTVQEGGVVIAPHQGPFLRYQKEFLDGLRKCPASIVNPPGVNPYGAAMNRPGRWMMVWIPEKAAKVE